MNYVTEVLSSTHRKDNFECGKPMLDNYLTRQAGQDMKKGLAVCYVITAEDEMTVAGYYTLSSNSIPKAMIPELFSKKFPNSYDSIPTILVGRLAVDSKFQGEGFGSDLLIDALKRSWGASKKTGIFAVVLDPLDEEATRFYEKYGFLELMDSRELFLPMKSIERLFT